MKRLLFFQPSDYRDTYFFLEKGHPETYIFQKQFLEIPSSLINKYGVSDVCVVSLGGTELYDEIMPNGVRAVGIPFSNVDRSKIQRKICRFVDSYSPTHSVVQVPVRELIKCCIRSKINTYVMIADNFSGRGFRGLIWCKLFALLLNSPYIEIVSNHNYPASRLLRRFGVHAHKIVPWDVPWNVNDFKFAPKVLEQNHKTWTLFYAGRVSQEKGVGDIIKAVCLLKKRGPDFKVVIAGYGDIAYFQNQAAALNIADRITFLGNISHNKVIDAMRYSDIIIVPSTIKASEGMPFTIYESFIVKTPLVLSDHPMFRAAIKNGVFFKAGNAKSLASALNSLIDNPVLYHKLSSAAEEAFMELIVPFSFIDIINHWLSDTVEDKKWLLSSSLKHSNR